MTLGIFNRTAIRPALFALLTALTGCGSSEATASDGSTAGGSCPAAERCIAATFEIVGQQTFSFAETSTTAKSTETLWSMEAKNVTSRYGVVLIWSPTVVTQPGDYAADRGLLELNVMVVRPHPTDPGKVRASSTRGGTMHFDRVAYASGSVVSGTFEGMELIRDAPDDTIQIKLSEGTFSGFIP